MFPVWSFDRFRSAALRGFLCYLVFALAFGAGAVTKKKRASSSASRAKLTQSATHSAAGDSDKSDASGDSAPRRSTASAHKKTASRTGSSSRKKASSGTTSSSHKKTVSRTGSSSRATASSRKKTSSRTVSSSRSPRHEAPSHSDSAPLKSAATHIAPALPAQAVPASLPGPLVRAQTTLDAMAPFRRCLWVTRWDYTSAADLAKICYNAASARFTDMMFQVRGAGTVFYPSAYEPWAPQMGGSNPGWDPLATVIREAHKYGLRVHAYMNVLPAACSGETEGTIYSQHRSWMMVSAGGDTMRPGGGFYAFADPGLPEVRAYLAKVFAEVATKYAVDGIHLDYIRYPDERGDYSYHPTVVARFTQLYGARPASRPEQWADFRRAQITQTIEAIAKSVRAARPGIELSAAVVADPSRGVGQAYQSALEWVRSGLLDAIAPMAYSGDVDKFETLCAPYRAADVRNKVWLGVWADPKRNTCLESEVRRAIAMKFGAVAVFSYSELFPSHQASTRAKGVYQAFVDRQTVVSER